MYARNKLLHRSSLPSVLVVAGLLSLGSGCQSRQLSWVGAQNNATGVSTRPDLTVRQLSLAESQGADPTSGQLVSPSGQLAPRTSPTIDPLTQLASAQVPAGLPAADISNQQARYDMPVGEADRSSSQVVQAQYPAAANFAAPAKPANPAKPVRSAKYAPIGRSQASENIPRVAMGHPSMPMLVGEGAPPSQGPSFSIASHGRGAGHTHADGKCNCGGSGVYKPVFPRLSGNSGCQLCGAAHCSGGCGQTMPEEGFAVPRTTDAQEFIFDGGDHDPKVRLREDLSQVGLDPEDTVIQYETADGKTNVESGCRVAIYAPRFASVRKRQSSQEREIAMRARSTLQPDGPGILRDQLPPIHVSKPVKSSNSDNVRVVEAFRDRSRLMPAERVLPMVTVSDAFKPFEDLSLIRNGDLRRTDLAKLAKSTAAARGWTNVDELHVIIDGAEAIEMTASQNAADVTLYEFKGARIRLCKVASDQMANPGDIVSFTIRFDNVGEQPLKSLVVTDSLAPRLEYVDKSQQASVAANFSISPNTVGSSILRWELEDGLKPGDGGLVRFSCKVR